MTETHRGPDRTVLRARGLGIEVSPGRLTRRFACPLPGHSHSARLVYAGGFWKLDCRRAGRLLELGEVRAAQAYGVVKKISEVQCARWLERLDREVGLLDRGPAQIPLPPDASEATRRLGESWRLLVGIRDPRAFPLAYPFLFARRFAMAWGGVSEQEARDGVEALEEYGSMIRVGQHPCRAIEWRPGPSFALLYDDVAVAEAHTIQILKERFGAVEE